MDAFENPLEFISTASLILLMLLNTHRTLSLSLCSDMNYPEEVAVADGIALDCCVSNSLDVNATMRAALQHLRLWNSFTFLDDELGFWVKPRSTTWFSRFLLEECGDESWVQMFRMTKRSLFSLAELLTPATKKNDTKYRLAIPVLVRLGCTLFKLNHGASLLICSEMFAVGRSTVSILLRQVVHAINIALRTEISWPTGDVLKSIAKDFEQLCGLPGVVGAIDSTHISISKPNFGAADYYYFKSGGYTINCQAVVDASKRFLDLYVGMPGSTNDSRMLRRSTLYRKGQRQILWDASLSFHGFSPYLLGDAGYPLLPWLMVPHRQQCNLSVADSLFNKKLSRGRVVVENAFGLLKLSFRELHVKSDLHVRFIPDVVTCCALLHNVLLKQSHEDVERLLQILEMEENQRNQRNLPVAPPESAEAAVEQPDVEGAMLKRRELGIFLTLQRIVPF